MAKQQYNDRIDVIIPAYNVPDNILFRCLSSIACQDIVSEVDITIVDDASTEQNYEEVAKRFENMMNIKVLRYDINGGPGVARQYGLDSTYNGFVTFIDADDTFNGSLALKALKTGIEYGGGVNAMCVGVFDEIHEHDIQSDEGPLIINHENDLVWMFGKMYRRSFLDKYDIRFHETSRANEDTGFNTICRLCETENEKIYFIGAHVYYWHENLNSITRANDCQYSYGSSERDSFYGYTENMIYAYNEAKKRNKYDEKVDQWGINTMFNLYEYYIECAGRAPEHAEKNFEACRKYYDEVYRNLEEDVTPEMFAKLYNELMMNAYIQNKLEGIIPEMSIFDFFKKLKETDDTVKVEE